MLLQRRTFLFAATAAPWVSNAAAAEAGVSDKELVIGQTAILSGPLGVPVNARMAGAQLAFAESRRQGGIFGRNVRIVAMDDELKPERALANYEKLISEERVLAFFGCGGSATTAAAAGLLERGGAPLIGGFAVADSAREKVKSSAYFLRATSQREADVLVQHLATIGVERVAVAYLDNPGGTEALEMVKKAMTRNRMTPHAAVAVKGDGSNVRDAAKALAERPPQAILMYLGGPLPGELIKATAETSSRPMWYGMSIVGGELTAKVAGEKARGLVIAQVVPYPWNQSDAVASEFRALAARTQVPVDYYTFEGYLTGQLLLEALRRTGRDVNRAKLQATMRSLKFRLGNLNVDFSGGSGTGSEYVELVQVTQDGRFIR